MIKTERIFYYDVLRAIAIVGIVFCHSSIAFVLNDNISNSFSFYISVFFDCFRDFSIPVFVMLSGALLIGKKDSITKFFKKRLSRIFIPFIFWAAIYVLYALVFMNHNLSVNDALNIFLGKSGSIGVIFWFIWMIIIAYIGIYIINRAIDFKGKKIMPILTALSVIFIIACEFGLINPLASKLIYYLSFMTYIVIGYFLATYIGKDLAIPALIIFIASYLFYVHIVIQASIVNGHFSPMNYFKVTILVMSASLFLFFKSLERREKFKSLENRTFGKIVKTISQYSFGIYLSHYLILTSLKNNILKFTDYTSQSPLFWIPVLVVVSLTLSLIISWLLSRIPYIGPVSGKS